MEWRRIDVRREGSGVEEYRCEKRREWSGGE